MGDNSGLIRIRVGGHSKQSEANIFLYIISFMPGNLIRNTSISTPEVQNMCYCLFVEDSLTKSE